MIRNENLLANSAKSGSQDRDLVEEAAFRDVRAEKLWDEHHLRAGHRVTWGNPGTQHGFRAIQWLVGRVGCFKVLQWVDDPVFARRS